MSGQRQKIRPDQWELAFMAEGRSEAPKSVMEGTETLVAKRMPENPAETAGLMEEVCEHENCMQALKRVKSNKGVPGVDGMTVEELPVYLRQHGLEIREQLLAGTYVPKPVKRVEIPKPDGGVRKLGIPSVLDRFVQQAVLQVLQKRWDPTFSDHSYGFRPGRSARQAVRKAQEYIAAGYHWCVDLDLEQFFDRVNHDRLMSAIAQRVSDRRMLQLIGAFLKAGVVMENGLVRAVEEGTPQGGPLSPLLSNLVLDELDQELERRGHRFVRYADDENIYVASERAGQRVMESVTRFITERLKLKVNQAKSAVDRPSKRKFLGFSFTNGPEPRRRIAPKAKARFKERIKKLTRRTRGISLPNMVKELATYLRGWLGYFGYCQTPSVLKELEQWLRHRLRAVAWKQWKTGRKRFRELRKWGVNKDLAAKTASSSRGPWRIAQTLALKIAMPNVYLASLGLPAMIVRS